MTILEVFKWPFLKKRHFYSHYTIHIFNTICLAPLGGKTLDGEECRFHPDLLIGITGECNREDTETQL